MKVTPIITRLQLELPQLRKVGGAADIPSAQEAFKQAPAAFVLPLEEAAQPNELESGAMSQYVGARFGVLWAVGNVRDTTGEAAQVDLEALRDAAKAVLLGWPPDETSEPCEFAGGQLFKFQDRVLWWLDEYFTGFYLRKTNG